MINEQNYRKVNRSKAIISTVTPYEFFHILKSLEHIIPHVVVLCCLTELYCSESM